MRSRNEGGNLLVLGGYLVGTWRVAHCGFWAWRMDWECMVREEWWDIEVQGTSSFSLLACLGMAGVRLSIRKSALTFSEFERNTINLVVYEYLKQDMMVSRGPRPTLTQGLDKEVSYVSMHILIRSGGTALLISAPLIPRSFRSYANSQTSRRKLIMESLLNV